MGNNFGKFTRRTPTTPGTRYQFNSYAECEKTLKKCQDKNKHVHRKLSQYIEELDESFGQLHDENIDDIISALKKIEYDNFNVVPKGGRRTRRNRGRR